MMKLHMMKLQWIAALIVLSLASVHAEKQAERPNQEELKQAELRPTRVSAESNSDDAEQLRADLQRMKVLLNQMRTNLAFVQSSQTPLKHQFELEADAWQVIVEQMERRLERIKGQAATKPEQR